MKDPITTPGKTYAVTSPNGCTVTTEDGLTLAEIEAGKQGYFVAVGGKVLLSDDSAILTQVFSGALIAGGNGGGGGKATGEKVLPLEGDALVVQHATWFVNAAQGSIAVQPGAWKEEVMTCYLKTAVPVELAGVTWLYGQPFMGAGYTYVVALQQVDADTVLANLAYSLPK